MMRCGFAVVLMRQRDRQKQCDRAEADDDREYSTRQDRAFHSCVCSLAHSLALSTATRLLKTRYVPARINEAALFGPSPMCPDRISIEEIVLRHRNPRITLPVVSQYRFAARLPQIL